MPPYRRLEVWQDVEWTLLPRLAVVGDAATIAPVYDLTGDETLAITVPRSSPSYAQMQEKRILRLIRRKADGTEVAEEWRIWQRDDSSAASSELATVTAKPILLDLGDAVIRQAQSDGSTLYNFGFVGLTLLEVWDTYCYPALVAIGKPWITRHTFDFAGTFDFDFDQQTVLSLLRAIADKLNLEMRLTMDSDGLYRVNLVNQVGAGAYVPRVQVRKNLDATSRTRSSADLVTRPIPQGTDAEDGTHVGIEAVRWVITFAGAGRVAIADLLGRFTPIWFDDQLNGWYLFRELTGRSILIIDTIESAQDLQLADLSTITVGEIVSLRRTDAFSNTLNWRGHAGVVPLYYITAVNGGTSRIAIADSVGGATGQIPADGDMVDWTMVPCLKIVNLTYASADAIGQYFALSGSPNLSGVRVGDVCFVDASGNASPSFGGSVPMFPIGTVTAVDNVLKRITVSNRYDPDTPVIAASASGAGTVRIYRPNIPQIVSHSFAASSELQLPGVGGLALNQLVEIRQPSGGVPPVALDVPSLTASYGQVERIFSRSDVRGETNLVPNPFMRLWTGLTTSPPDGWSSSGAVAIAQTSDPLYTTYGGFAALLTFTGAGSLISPAFPVWRIGVGQRSRVSTRARLVFTQFSGSIELDIVLVGSVSGVIAGSAKKLYPMNHPTAADADKYDVNVPYEVGLASVDLSAALQRETFTLVVQGVNPIGVAIDVLQVTQTTYDPGVFIEGAAGCELWNEGNRQLDENGQPVTQYSVQMKDLERIDGTPWTKDAIVLGGAIDLRDDILGITATPRVVRYEPNEVDPLSSKLTLSTRYRTLTKILATV